MAFPFVFIKYYLQVLSIESVGRELTCKSRHTTSSTVESAFGELTAKTGKNCFERIIFKMWTQSVKKSVFLCVCIYVGGGELSMTWTANTSESTTHTHTHSCIHTHPHPTSLLGGRHGATPSLGEEMLAAKICHITLCLVSPAPPSSSPIHFPYAWELFQSFIRRGNSVYFIWKKDPT